MQCCSPHVDWAGGGGGNWGKRKFGPLFPTPPMTPSSTPYILR